MAEDIDEFERRLGVFREACTIGDLNEAIEHGEWLANIIGESVNDKFEIFNGIIPFDDVFIPLSLAYKERGQKYYQADDYYRAINDFWRAENYHPSDPEPPYFLALAHQKTEKIDEAIEFFNDAIKNHLEFKEAYLNRGILYFKKGQYERAIEDFDIAIELEPEEAGAYVNRGSSYNGLKQYERAIADYDKAIELEANLVAAYNNRGNSYNELKQYERAIEDFNKAIELKPDYAEAYNGRGANYAQLEQYERAIEDFDKAIELKPDYAGAHFNRGISYARIEKSARAIDDFTKAIGLQPENSSAYALRSMIYTNINKFDVAIEDIKRAISSDNNQRIYLDIFSDILQKKFNLQNNQTTEGKSEALRNKREKLFKGSFKKIIGLWLGLLIIFFLFSNPQLLTLFTCSGSFDELDLNPISEFSFTAITITTTALIAPWIWQVKIAINETMVYAKAELDKNFDERFAQLGASKSFDSINMPITSISQPLDESRIFKSFPPQ